MEELSSMEKHLMLCREKAELMEQVSKYRKVIELIANCDNIDAVEECQNVINEEWEILNTQRVNDGKINIGSNISSEQSHVKEVQQDERDSFMEEESSEPILEYRTNGIKVEYEGRSKSS